ncbi:unnamed protein product, partial [Aphanomyces euteiches]
ERKETGQQSDRTQPSFHFVKRGEQWENMSSQPTSSIEERLVAAADNLDGLVAKISPVQRDVRKVLKEFREFKGSHVKKEDYDRLRSDYEKVVKEKQEQERQGVKKEDYERLRNDHKASEKDREKRIEEIPALKLEVERLTQARDKYRDQVKQQDLDREKHVLGPPHYHDTFQTWQTWRVD